MNFYIRLLFLAFLFSAVACTSPRKMARALAHQSVDLALSELFKIHKKGTIALPLENGMGNENFTPYRFVRFVPSIRKGTRGDTLVVDYEFYDSTWRARAHQLIDIIFKKSMENSYTQNLPLDAVLNAKFWAIEGVLAHRYSQILESRLVKGETTLFPIQKNAVFRMPNDDKTRYLRECYEIDNEIITIKIEGVLSPNGDYCSIGTKDYIFLLNEAIKDNSIRGIFLEIDSPGGNADCIQSLHETVRDCPKPIVSFAYSNACSAAYWATCAANYFFAASKDTSSIGSIGVFMLWVGYYEMEKKMGLAYEYITADQSREKTLGNPHEPLTDEARKKLKAQATKVCTGFINDIKATRPNVSEEAFTGLSFTGEDALALGLIDAICTKEQAMQELINLITL